MNGKVPEPLIDALANIAVIGPTINIRISAKDPMSYISTYNISDRKLSQQFIDSAVVSVSREEFEPWLRERARNLADVANTFLAELSQSL